MGFTGRVGMLGFIEKNLDTIDLQSFPSLA
jgi:hypothetical protein